MWANRIKKLNDSQVEAFDTEYVDDARWETVKAGIDQDFSNGEFCFLDVGGGNGRFADRVLAGYPKAKGTVIDNSEVLLGRNEPNDRKTVNLYSVEDIGSVNKKYDIIFVHWLLHHIVSDGYKKTYKNQVWTLKVLSALLTAKGRISVFENIYDGSLIDNLPGRMIFYLTSNQTIRGLTNKLGANTAGVGVCFLSKKRWFSTIQSASLQVLRYTEPDKWTWFLPLPFKVFLHIRQRYVGHFWLSAPKGFPRNRKPRARGCHGE